jgi:hypothetical protein
MSNPDSANWIYAMDDAALLEGHMAAAYPLGVNVLIAPGESGSAVQVLESAGVPSVDRKVLHSLFHRCLIPSNAGR